MGCGGQVKTRMQLQVGKPVPGQEHYNGMVDTFQKIIAREGYVLSRFISIRLEI